MDTYKLKTVCVTLKLPLKPIWTVISTSSLLIHLSFTSSLYYCSHSNVLFSSFPCSPSFVSFTHVLLLTPIIPPIAPSVTISNSSNSPSVSVHQCLYVSCRTLTNAFPAPALPSLPSLINPNPSHTRIFTAHRLQSKYCSSCVVLLITGSEFLNKPSRQCEQVW